MNFQEKGLVGFVTQAQTLPVGLLCSAPHSPGISFLSTLIAPSFHQHLGDFSSVVIMPAFFYSEPELTLCPHPKGLARWCQVVPSRISTNVHQMHEES